MNAGETHWHSGKWQGNTSAKSWSSAFPLWGKNFPRGQKSQKLQHRIIADTLKEQWTGNCWQCQWCYVGRWGYGGQTTGKRKNWALEPTVRKFTWTLTDGKHFWEFWVEVLIHDKDKCFKKKKTTYKISFQSICHLGIKCTNDIFYIYTTHIYTYINHQKLISNREWM